MIVMGLFGNFSSAAKAEEKRTGSNQRIDTEKTVKIILISFPPAGNIGPLYLINPTLFVNEAPWPGLKMILQIS
jgi:hypothetical protein